MSSQLLAICFDAIDPQRVARFWSEFLGRDTADDPHGGIALLPSDDTGYRLSFVPTEEPKVYQNRMHFDLTSTSAEDQQQNVARALELGARHADVGQVGDEGHVVMADPEGNEFDLLEAGNNFLANCGFLGALACDGSQAVGYFWSAALDWPLVWDENEETAIQSPHGGTKITWGGPPRMPGRNRTHYDLVADGDLNAEVDRLISLGAKLIDTGQGSRVTLADPDDNEFCVLSLA